MSGSNTAKDCLATLEVNSYFTLYLIIYTRSKRNTGSASQTLSILSSLEDYPYSNDKIALWRNRGSTEEMYRAGRAAV